MDGCHAHWYLITALLEPEEMQQSQHFLAHPALCCFSRDEQSRGLSQITGNHSKRAVPSLPSLLTQHVIAAVATDFCKIIGKVLSLYIASVIQQLRMMRNWLQTVFCDPTASALPLTV